MGVLIGYKNQYVYIDPLDPTYELKTWDQKLETKNPYYTFFGITKRKALISAERLSYLVEYLEKQKLTDPYFDEEP